MARIRVVSLGRIGAGAAGESCDKTKARDASAITITSVLTLTILEDRVIDVIPSEGPMRVTACALESI
jgi:hypothetical protein